MKISTIPQIYRNANRWREIFQILSKHGLASWLSQFDLPFVRGLTGPPDNGGETGDPTTDSNSPNRRIRRALEELGPTFIKLGQVLSTRPDLVGVALADELTALQASAPVDSADYVRAVLQEDFGRPVDACYAKFEETPVASASIGQVHRAWLADGTAVAVKVLHDSIESRVHVDTDILMGLAELAERLPELKNYRPTGTAAEFKRTIRRELDFSHEARRLSQFGCYFEDDQRVQIPAPIMELCSQRVLTCEWLEGEKLSSPTLRQRGDLDLATAARNGAEVFLEMIFEHGVYHADPHPGNLLVIPESKIGLLDFGMVGRLSESLRENLEDVLAAVSAEDATLLTSLVMRIGSTPPHLDEALLATDVTDFIEYYGNQSVGGFDVGGALAELVEIIRRHEIVLPAALGMLVKLLVMLEGSAKLLEPNFNLMEVLAPLEKKIRRRRLSPLRQAKKLGRIYSEVEQLAEVLPRRIREILHQVQTDSFDVHLDHRGLEPSVNRLVLGMITSALFLGSSLMLSRDVWPLLGVSIPGLVGLLLSGVLGLRVFWAINKSGRLERRR